MAGRPPSGRPHMRKSSIALPEEHFEKLAELGHGNVARAIRHLAENKWPELKEAPQRPKYG